MSEEDLERIGYELYALRARAEELQRQANALNEMAEAAEATGESISGLGREAVFQLGAGTMTKAAPFGKILVETGAGVVVEKAPDEAKKVVEAREAEARAALAHVQKELTEVVARTRELNERAEKLRKGAEGLPAQ